MNQILALWTHPRSLSTALERAVMERGDFEVLHEPFSVVYYQHEQRANAVQSELPRDQPTDYQSVRDGILQAAQTRPVCFKDMCYHCCEHLKADREFLSRLTNVFLVRDPKPTIASHYAMNPDMTLEEIGYEKQFAVFQMVRDSEQEAPLVISAEDLQRDPAATLRVLWAKANVEDRPDVVQWQAGHRSEWDTWKAWHTDAASSTGISNRKTEYQDTVDNNPALSAFDTYHRHFYAELYRHCVPLGDDRC